MGCVHMEACLLGNPLAWSRFLMDELCSHIQQMTAVIRQQTLTGWHGSCTIYFSPTLIAPSLSFSLSHTQKHSFPDICFFFLLLNIWHNQDKTQQYVRFQIWLSLKYFTSFILWCKFYYCMCMCVCIGECFRLQSSSFASPQPTFQQQQ